MELLEVGHLDDHATVDIDDVSAMFVESHSWALGTGTDRSVIATSDPDHRLVTARYATPSALVAMKLGAIESRPARAGQSKRGSDATDLYRLLNELNRDGSVGAGFSSARLRLRALTVRAAQRVLVDNAARTTRWMSEVDDFDVSEENLRAVAEQFIAEVDGLR